MIEHLSQLESVPNQLRRTRPAPIACLAIAIFGWTTCVAEAQSLFRKPVVPSATTVSSQIIDRANIPIVLGQADSPVVQNNSMESIDPVDLDKPSTSFLPPPASSADRNFKIDGGLDDLTDKEFESRLLEMQNDADDSDEPFIESLPEESNFGDDQPGRETIRQRYPDGKTHVLRQVAQDAAGNYYNDGAWRVYSRGGDVIAEGQFKRNQMVGQWRRYHNANSGGLFSTAPFNNYEGRFLSVAQFEKGKLNGMWTIYDQNNQKVFEVRYSQGKRDGVATWWFPTATKMREATFDNGLLNGKVLEWDDQGKLTRRDEFIRGQRVVRQVSRYRPNRPSEEQFYLDGKLVLEDEDRWWEAKPAAFSTSGQRTQHGPIRRWYENGQPKMQGQYEKDQRIGKFTWWHTNGGRKLEAGYVEGQKAGMWTWWHENGMKSIQGEYKHDKAVGTWTWWDEKGAVTRQEDFDKLSRGRDGSTGELTEPNPVPDGDSTRRETIVDAPEDDDSEDSAPATSDSDSQIPMLLDTDALEEIDPLENTPGTLPTELPENFLDSDE